MRRIAAAAAGIALLAGVGTLAALLLGPGDEPGRVDTAAHASADTTAPDTAGGASDGRIAGAGAGSQQDEADDARLVRAPEAATRPERDASTQRALLAAEGVVAPDPGAHDPALMPTGAGRMAFATELLPDGGPWAAVRSASPQTPVPLAGGLGADVVPAPPKLIPAPGEPGEAVRARVDATFAAIAGAPALAPDELGLDAQPAAEPESVVAEETLEAETVPLPPPAPKREEARTAPREQRTARANTAEPSRSARQARAVRAVNLRTRPQNGASTITVVPAGSRIDVVGCDHWCRVIYDGREGYVYKSFVSGT